MIVLTEIPWTFKTWIANFREVDLPIGDFANDIEAVEDFPDEEQIEILIAYLVNRKCDSEQIEMFTNIWQFYKLSK